MKTKLQPKLRGIFLADDMLENLSNPVGDFFSTVLSAVCNFLYSPIDWLINTVSNFFSTIVSAVTNFFSYLIGMLTKPFINFFSTVIFAVSNFFHYLIDLTNSVGDFFSMVVSAVSNFFQNMVSSIGHFFTMVISSLTDFFQNLANSVGDFFSMAVSTVSSFFTTVMSSVTDFFQHNQTLDTVINSVSDFFSTVVPTVTSFFQNLGNSLSDFFTTAISSVTDFFQYLIVLFNQEFPPEKRDEQIQSLIFYATYYLLPAVILITFIYLSRYILPYVQYILQGCFTAFKQLFSCIQSTVVQCFNGLRWFWSYIFQCLRTGTELGVKMMVAPGQPLLRISRAAFEANPAGYFRSLRGLPNNFVS